MHGTSPSFTLVELLIVIGILAILATVVVLVINPAELSKQARDSTRVSDLRAINTALTLADLESLSPGSANTVYVSIPDASSTCGNLGLPSLPAGYSYACATSANYRKVDGTGWIPVAFSNIIQGSPLTSLPIDPVNTTSSGNYYTYVTGGSWELTAVFEADKHDVAIKDGDSFPGTYSIGSHLGLTPPSRDKGLIGYWPLDEGSGTTAYDQTASGNNGTLTNGPTWQTSANCKEGACLSFDGTDDHIPVTNVPVDTSSGADTTVIFWMYWGGGAYDMPFGFNTYDLWLNGGLGFNAGCGALYGASDPGFTSTWYHVAAVFHNQGTSQNKLYLNGVLQSLSGSESTCDHSVGTTIRIGAWPNDLLYAFGGRLDDVRIYNRALSAAEVDAIYTATR